MAASGHHNKATRTNRPPRQTSQGNSQRWNSHDLEVAQNHAAAAKALTKKLNWIADYHMGGTPDGYVFVIADKSSKAW